MFDIRYSLDEICAIVSPLNVIGNTDATISGICDLGNAAKNDLSFLGNKKYYDKLHDTHASVVLVSKDMDVVPHKNQCFLICENPSFALGLLCRDIENKSRQKIVPEIHPSAIISKSSKIGNNVIIGPNVVIEDHVEIGNNVIITAGCYIGKYVKIGDYSELRAEVKIMSFCMLGSHVILHPGVVIGSDGFGYETVNGVHEKIPQIGNVVIENDVEIGANTTIDRARFSSTIIGEGTKIDNLVQIGHNVRIGKHCLIVAQVGIAGSAIIGDYVIIGGQSGIAGHITIGDKSVIAGQTGVASSCKNGSFLRGAPAMPYNDANRFLACRKYLPELVKKVRFIEEKLELS